MMMDSKELYNYIVRYLSARGCTILEQTPSYLTVRLSEEADREIMNRPYYWLYVERTGIEAEPMTVTFYFDPDVSFSDQRRAELIHFGSPRLHLIFQSCQKNGRFIRLYEETSSRSKALTPWICINYKISFISDQKKDLIYPLGFNLINGEIIAPFGERLNRYRLTPKIPDYHFTLTPIFSLNSAVKRIELYLSRYLKQMDQSWAIEAQKRLEQEAELIRSFFENEADRQSILERRLAELEEYRPRIEVNPINIGLFYLETHPLETDNQSLNNERANMTIEAGNHPNQ
jgi:hypothetical protein